jgi:hypothetical protein
MAFAEDLTQFFDPAGFAVPATATLAGGPVVIQVIFDQPYAQGLGDLMSASQPQFIARSSDAAALQVGTPVQIEGTQWLVAQPVQADGTGISTVLLERAV